MAVIDRKEDAFMKRIKPVLIPILLTALLFTGCGKKFTCGICHQEKTGKQYTVDVLGIQTTVCEKCNASMNVLEDALTGDIDESLLWGE